MKAEGGRRDCSVCVVFGMNSCAIRMDMGYYGLLNEYEPVV